MPEQRTLEDLVPGPDSRDRRVHQHEMGHPLGLFGHEGVGDHVADIVGDHVDLAHVQGVQHAGDVLALGLLVIARGRVGREAHAAQVGDHHGVGPGQLDRQGLPHVAGFAVAVQQHHGRTVAADADEQPGPVGGDHPGLEARRIGVDGRERRAGQNPGPHNQGGDFQHAVSSHRLVLVPSSPAAGRPPAADRLPGAAGSCRRRPGR